MHRATSEIVAATDSRETFVEPGSYFDAGVRT